MKYSQTALSKGGIVPIVAPGVTPWEGRMAIHIKQREFMPVLGGACGAGAAERNRIWFLANDPTIKGEKS